MPRMSSQVPATQTSKMAQSTSNAIELLEKDHKEVKTLFRKYGQLVKADADSTERQQLALQICKMLTVHAQIEEEIFYPAAREVIPEEDLIDEATVEHASAKDLIAQIEGAQADDPLYDAKVTVLGEYIDHHVKEEEQEMFPKLRRRLDIKEIGLQLERRKEELLADMIPDSH